MNKDDDLSKSFERLDETKQERNKRSFFDWLIGREESEEEKLRKKLDKELKEAARKRAEQFEEELREQEQRDVAETKKLKKRWRKKLVEKSQKQIADAEVRPENEMNGYEIAQVMVAERIVKLHEMLNDESLDLRRSEVKALKINIDFLGLLSEKLSRPELEVPEEVEQLYQTIAESIEDTTGEPVPETEQSRAFHQPNTPAPADSSPNRETDAPPTSEADASYTAFAAGIVYAIRRSVQKTEDKENSKLETTSPAETKSTESPTITTPEKTTSKVTKPLLDNIRQNAQSTEQIRQEISRESSVRRMAEIVEKAEMINTGTKTPAAVETAPIAAVIAATKLATGEKKVKSETAREIFPDISMELWNEADLVRKAEQVDIGYGRRLAAAYRNGEIDREGLIKVLKSHKKHKNYLDEYRRQIVRWRKSREVSPEIKDIPEPQAPTQPPTPPTPSPKSRAETENFEAVRPPVKSAVKKPLDELAEITEQARNRVKKQASFLMLVTSLILLILLLMTVWFINSL